MNLRNVRAWLTADPPPTCPELVWTGTYPAPCGQPINHAGEHGPRRKSRAARRAERRAAFRALLTGREEHGQQREDWR